MDKIKCSECEFCKEFRKVGNVRSEFTCAHPNKEYVLKYFDERRMVKMPGFLGFGERYSHEVPVKTSPKWCPLLEKEYGNDD